MEVFFRVTGPLWGGSTDDRWIPLTMGRYSTFSVFFDFNIYKLLPTMSSCRCHEMLRRWYDIIVIGVLNYLKIKDMDLGGLLWARICERPWWYRCFAQSNHPILADQHTTQFLPTCVNRPRDFSYGKQCTVKPVYNDHLMGYFSAFWSSSRWPKTT